MSFLQSFLEKVLHACLCWCNFDFNLIISKPDICPRHGWYKIEKITGSCDPEAQALAIYVQNAMPISIAVSGGPNGEVIDPKPISKSPTVFRVDYEYSFITSATIKSLSSKRFVIHARKGRCAGAEFTFRAG